ncbi:MAG: phosphatase PAP2 family protein [Lachnospiraceae bacterium]|nr:phosphatase PAP2 family protein [Lachnospiraceae bacterium]MBQ2576845.1 phosphatase PAP2 family protein [Lachnospiraceae bacterium]MBQ5485588.1 phosphatase PAP2 family protein [Lachnospiraceae bacterium]
MKDTNYLRLNQLMHQRRRYQILVKVLEKMVTLLTFASYPLLLAYVYFKKIAWLLPMVLVPAFGFLAVTFIRSGINAKRPYENLGYEPVIQKDTTGHSFPSRHAFSIFMIAITYFFVDKGSGVLVGFMGVLLCVLRVLGGVHYIRDVVAGASSAVIYGAVCYLLIL